MEFKTADGEIDYHVADLEEINELSQFDGVQNPVVLDLIQADEIGQGQGSNLLKAFIKHVKERGHDFIYAWVQFDPLLYMDEDEFEAMSEEAQKEFELTGLKKLVGFYEKHGFRRVPYMDVYPGAMVDMYLHLDSKAEAIEDVTDTFYKALGPTQGNTMKTLAYLGLCKDCDSLVDVSYPSSYEGEHFCPECRSNNLLSTEEAELDGQTVYIAKDEVYNEEGEFLGKYDELFKTTATSDIIDDIDVGDLVDFGAYGKLYVVDLNYHSNKRFWVTDDKASRFDPDASGWAIDKDLAEKIIEKACDCDCEDCQQGDCDMCEECDCGEAEAETLTSRGLHYSDPMIWVAAFKDVESTLTSTEDMAVLAEIVESYGLKKKSFQPRGMLSGKFEWIDEDDTSYEIEVMMYAHPAEPDVGINDAYLDDFQVLDVKSQEPGVKISQEKINKIIEKVEKDKNFRENVEKDLYATAVQELVDDYEHYQDSLYEKMKDERAERRSEQD